MNFRTYPGAGRQARAAEGRMRRAKNIFRLLRFQEEGALCKLSEPRVDFKDGTGG